MVPNIKRVLVVPLNYSHHQSGQIGAFETIFGRENVREYCFWSRHRDGLSPEAISHELYSEAVQFKPDWIWMQLQDSRVILPRVIENIRRALPDTLITHWMGDVREVVSDYLSELCKATHATLISSVGQIDLYRAAGAKQAAYVQIGLDPEDVWPDHRWTVPEYMTVPDVVFCGGYYGQAFPAGSRQRLAAIRALQDAFGDQFGVFGSGWPDDVRVIGLSHVKQQAHIYRRARCVISINHFNEIERYYSDRFLIALASGRPVVARRVPGIELEFENNAECYFWLTNEELVEHVRFVLENPSHAEHVGRNGRRTAIANHTWEARLRWLLSHDIKQIWMRS